MIKNIAKLSAITLMATCAAYSTSAFSEGYSHTKKYQVTVTNITKGQSFTPILSATHGYKTRFFELGAPASNELIALAESGNVAPLLETLTANRSVKDTATTAGLLTPGSSVSFEIESMRLASLSLAAMLIPTNDTFFALDAVSLPRFGSRTYFAKAYDAGSETNDEYCANIPGPACGGVGLSEDDSGEGYVYISQGIHGEADLTASEYDFRGVVAKITISRMH
ncbi:MAG: hypothetical protein COA42_21395 [Alteromonadaceae bacterium]|nr:MAG: hypothetical protein COA42_21395 [Alteromonadaceae bacterium]